jgi:hypothetical protein
MNQIINGILILFLVFNQSCSSKSKVDFDKNLQQTQCEEALETVPENQSIYKLNDKIEKTTGTVLSYSFTGAAYTAQVVWDVTVGVAAVTIMCAPTIALSMAAKGEAGKLNPYCLSGDLKPLLSPPLGKNTYKNTESWRCSEVTPVSQSIRKVARCFSNRGTKENFTKALNTLEAVANSGAFYSCLPTNELNAFTQDLNEYRNEVAKNK